jgi:prophage regulatory protein
MTIQTAMDDRAPVTSEPRKMLNQEQVLQIIPVSAVTLWRMIKAGRFPKSTFISPNRCIWYADEIAAWQTEISGCSRRGANHLRRSKSEAQ